MTPAIRISLGIVALTTTLLLAADWVLGIFPDPYAPVLEARQELSESLAIQYSTLVTVDRLPDMQLAMELIVGQMPDVLSMNLQKPDGESIAATREHISLWKETGTERSTPTQVLIPIFQGEEQWAVLQVKFDALPNSGFFGLVSTPLYKLILAMAVAGFLAYLLFLSRTLRYLDPSAVVPSRVKAALDQLVEGVFILDHEQRIVLVNSSFANQMSLTPDDLIGVDPSRLPWLKSDSDSGSSEMPWAAAIRLGTRLKDERLELQSPALGKRVFTTNVSPIMDGGGKQRGVLASFNDISELEQMNDGLRDTLKNLEAAHMEVRIKNEELLYLATIDPLTECFNRRAFFEKLELEFELAKRDKLKLSVVMADIDHFKMINDDFGHGAGDVVIKEMARTLTESVGVDGFVGRYGGEEFCMVLVGTGEMESIQLSNRARLVFESSFQASDSVTEGRLVTASFGVSTISFGAESITDFLNQADLALYHSKDNGRNCVSSWMDVDINRKEAS